MRDRDLSGAGARLGQKLSDAADAITSAEFPALLDELMMRCIDATFLKARASEGTIWLIDAAAETLVASYNTRDSSFVGFVQPLGSGFVSMVVATEQSICENEVHRSRKHSGAADASVGKVTRAMIAVPLYFGAALRGVVSCVQHDANHSDRSDAGFGPDELSDIELLAEVLGRLIDYRLSSRLLGLDE